MTTTKRQDEYYSRIVPETNIDRALLRAVIAAQLPRAGHLAWYLGEWRADGWLSVTWLKRAADVDDISRLFEDRPPLTGQISVQDMGDEHPEITRLTVLWQTDPHPDHDVSSNVLPYWPVMAGDGR